jgi:hypothetical protein
LIGLKNSIPSFIIYLSKENTFVFLNFFPFFSLHELASWVTNFTSQRKLLSTYYESWAFVLVNNNNDLFESITNQLEKLSPLSFRLKYTIQRSSSSKKLNVKTWLRDRKTQVKTPPTKSISSVPPNVIIRRKFNSIPVSF